MPAAHIADPHVVGAPKGAFPFGLDFQRAAIRLAIEDEAFCHLACSHLEPSYFENAALTWVFGRVKEHWLRYARPSSFIALHEYLRELDPMVAQTYAPTVMQLEQTPVAEQQFIADKIVEFVKRNLFVAGMEQARALYNKGDVDGAFDFWMRRGDEINRVSLGIVDRGFFFEEVDERQQRREYKARAGHLFTFSTGIPDLDAILNGGLSIGEFGMWFAKQKAGKSMLLLWFAFFAVRALRIPVLVTVHEGGREYWEDRLESAFAHTVTSLVSRGEMDPATHARLLDEYRELKKLLVIRGYTKGEGTWNANVGDIESELHELRVRYGFVPKMIIPDYADLLRSRYKAETERDHQTEAAKDLATLAERGYAIWSASQVQRLPPAADRDPRYLIRAEQVADAIGKARIPTFYGSINRTKEEQKNQRVRLYAEEYRHGEAGRIIEVETDYSRARFVRSVLAAHDAPMLDATQDEVDW
jgi:replicative DNA helicase